MEFSDNVYETNSILVTPFYVTLGVGVSVRCVHVKHRGVEKAPHCGLCGGESSKIN